MLRAEWRAYKITNINFVALNCKRKNSTEVLTRSFLASNCSYMQWSQWVAILSEERKKWIHSKTYLDRNACAKDLYRLLIANHQLTFYSTISKKTKIYNTRHHSVHMKSFILRKVITHIYITNNRQDRLENKIFRMHRFFESIILLLEILYTML